MADAPGIPVFIDESSPRIADHARGLAIDDWQPANDATIKLIRCLEAIRDLKPICDFLACSPQAAADRRFIKGLATPLYTLVAAIRDMYGEIQNAEFKNMPKERRRMFRGRSEAFSKAVGGKDSRLKKVRDKIGAHVDKDAILGGTDVWADVDLKTFLDILRLCLVELGFLLHRDNYAWTRHTDAPNVLRLMSVDGTLVDLADVDGHLEHIGAISFVPSPRIGIINEVNAFVSTVNRIVAALSAASRPA